MLSVVKWLYLILVEELEIAKRTVLHEWSDGN